MRPLVPLAGLAVALAALVWSPSAAAEPGAVDQLLAVDREFSAYAAEHGTAAAFRTFMEPTDSCAFDGGGLARGAEARST